MEITHSANKESKAPQGYLPVWCSIERKDNVTRHLLTIGSLPRIQRALAITDPRVAADAI